MKRCRFQLDQRMPGMFQNIERSPTESTYPEVPRPPSKLHTVHRCIKICLCWSLNPTREDTDHPIAYVSRLFRGSQLNWAALTKEAYAIYMSVKKLSFYIDTTKVTVRSDHLPLKKFMEKNTMNSKVNNWAVELESQNIKFQYIPGVKNTLADTLNRLIEIDDDIKLPPEEEGKEFGYFPFEELPPVSTQVSEEILICDTHGTELKLNHTEPMNQEVDIQLLLSQRKMKKLQQSHSYIKHLLKQWEKNDLDKKVYTMESGLLKRKLIVNRLLYKPVVVPDILRDSLSILAHDEAGHNGSKRTYNALRNLFYWKGMKKSVHKHCTNCQTCAKHNVKVQQMKNKHFSAPLQPMEFIAMDLIGEFHPAASKGNRYALTAVCMLTGFTFCIPIKSKCTEDIVKAYLNHICCTFGPSRKILTDNGTEFKNKLWTEVFKKLNVEQKITPIYSPQCNGRIEGFHKILESNNRETVGKPTRMG